MLANGALGNVHMERKVEKGRAKAMTQLLTVPVETDTVMGGDFVL